MFTVFLETCLRLETLGPYMNYVGPNLKACPADYWLTSISLPIIEVSIGFLRSTGWAEPARYDCLGNDPVTSVYSVVRVTDLFVPNFLLFTMRQG